MNSSISELWVALRAESRKIWNSNTLWGSALAFLFITFICGLFMFILKDPESARSLGLLGAKAQLFGGTADWQSFFSLIMIMVSIGGLVIFGLIFIWIFGREFSEKTVYDMLSLPTSRVTIAIAKILTAAYWSLALIVMVFLLTLGVGTVLQLPGWSEATMLEGMKTLLVTGCLTIVLCIPFGLAASLARGYLPAIVAIFLVIMLDQIADRLGYGPYFPWDIPALYSGAAETLSGAIPVPLGAISYILVGLVGIISILAISLWWKYADQS